MQPSAWQPTTEAIVELKQLVRERETVVERLTQDTNHLLALHDARHAAPTVLQGAQARVDVLRAQLDALEQALRDFFIVQPRFDAMLKRLGSVPGFGVLSAAAVIAETDGCERLETGQEMSAYAGMAPKPNQSGTKRGKGSISKTGNARLRRIAYLAALGASRSNSRLNTLYQQWRARGKPPKVALVAVRRKLRRIGLAVVKSGKPYQEDFDRTRNPAQDGLGSTSGAPLSA